MYASALLVLALGAPSAEDDADIPVAHDYQLECASLSQKSTRRTNEFSTAALIEKRLGRLGETIKRCTPPDPPSTSADPTNATQKQIAILLAQLVTVDNQLALELFPSMETATVQNNPAILNELRTRIYAELSRYRPLAEVVEQVDRELKADFEDEQRAIASGCMPNRSFESGFVTISTRPFAKIYLNGRLVGDSPLSKLKVPTGCAEIRAVSSDGIERTEKIEVRANKVSIYTLDLRASDPSCAQDLTKDPGFITVSTKPWAKVYINGELAGEAPLAKYKVAAGCAEIRAVAAGGKEKVEKVTVRSNTNNIYLIELR